MLDVGATIRCEANELEQFALMGSAYARRISKVTSPTVGLLNMGSEEMKGGEILVEAHRRLRERKQINFVGNLEGHELVRGRADVIVCEGLLGNVALKLIEGVSEVFRDLTSAAAERSMAWRLGLRLLSGGVERLKDLTDYTRYGGSPILGFEHLFIKCHGRSTGQAIGNAVKVAAKAVRDRVPAEIADAVGG
jgi:glycerol-3-phosphate acyltransferase PlsX